MSGLYGFIYYIYRIQDTGCRIQDTVLRMQDAGCRMQDAGCRMQDAGYRIQNTVAEFNDLIERRFKFKPRLKYGWFHLKLYQMFQDLSRRLI